MLEKQIYDLTMYDTHSHPVKSDNLRVHEDAVARPSNPGWSAVSSDSVVRPTGVLTRS